MTINVSIAGAAGRMGCALIRCMQADHLEHLTLCGAFDQPSHPQLNQDVGLLAGIGKLDVLLTGAIADASAKANVIIDFTSPASTIDHAKWAAENGKSIVIGTTGLTDADKTILSECAQQSAIVQAPNMSLGVNLLFSLVNKAAQALAGKGYDAEIIERHHRRKKDAPSGTALGLGEELANGYGWDLNQVAIDGRTGISSDERPVEQIGFHAVRGGDIVGDHTVLFAAEGECIELSHRATSRDTFAMGALQATTWVSDKKPALYSMKDVLGI